LKRLGILVVGSVLLATVLVAGPATGAGAAGTSTGAAPVSHLSFSTPTHDGQPSSGQPLDVAGLPRVVAPHSSPAGSGFLAIFQEAVQGSLTIEVDGADPTPLGNGDFTYGLVPAGSYTITALDGGVTTATGTVVVGAGQYVTALVYLAVGGAQTITGFLNNRGSVPLGQARIVFRNTANVGPVDIYMNGTLVASDLANDPSAPTKFGMTVPAGSLTVQAVPTGHPEDQFIASETGVLLAGNLLNVFVVGDPAASPSTAGFLTNSNPLGTGYRLYAGDGGVFNFHNSGFFGSMGGMHLNQPIVGAAPTSLGLGYWLVAADGGIFTFGDAGFWGSTGNLRLNRPVVGMASTPDGGGYWLVASDGGIFTFGDAGFFGSEGAVHLNQPIVGMAATPDGGGYWLVASDGGVFTFGDATYFGSEGATHLNQPIVAIVPTVDGQGYWLVAADGGVFSFGDASFFGSTGGMRLNKPIVSAISTPDSLGYWLVAADGGIFNFGDAAFYGSTGNLTLNSPIVAGSSTGALVPG
jgi:hypothetical protein